MGGIGFLIFLVYRADEGQSKIAKNDGYKKQGG